MLLTSFSQSPNCCLRNTAGLALRTLYKVRLGAQAARQARPGRHPLYVRIHIPRLLHRYRHFQLLILLLSVLPFSPIEALGTHMSI